MASINKLVLKNMFRFPGNGQKSRFFRSFTNMEEKRLVAKDDRSNMADCSAEDVASKVSAILSPVGLESHPFKIGWYNDQLVHKAFNLSHPYDTLALVIISTPLMFDNGFKPFIKETSCVGGCDPLDEFMAHVFAKVKSEFPQHEIEAIHDFEMHPSRRPKVLVQTAAHVAGAAYYYQRSSVSSDPWDQKTKICGVSVHAKYGGWFAIRGVVIFKDILVPDLPKKEPVDVVQGDEKRIELLEKFNFHWKDWSFRDIVPTDLKYSEEQKNYFATLPADRKELLDSYRNKVGDPV